MGSRSVSPRLAPTAWEWSAVVVQTSVQQLDAS